MYELWQKFQKYPLLDKIVGIFLCIIIAGCFFLDTGIHRNLLYTCFPLGLYFVYKNDTSFLKDKTLIWRLTLLFLGFSLLSLFWSEGMDAARLWQKFKPAPFIFLTLIIYIAFFKKYPRSWNLFIDIFILSALLSALIVTAFNMHDILTYYFWDPNPRRVLRIEALGRAENANQAGLLYGIASLCALFVSSCFFKILQNKYIRISLFLFLFFMLFVTLSRGALLAYICTLLVASFLKTFSLKKHYVQNDFFSIRVIIGSVAIFILSLPFLIPDILVYMYNRGTTGRFKIWEIAWGHFLQSPWIGNGVGSKFIYDVYDKRPIEVGHPHSLYLAELVQVGIVGFILFMALAFTAFKEAVCSALKKHQYITLIFLTYGFLFGIADFGGYYTNLTNVWIVFWIPLSYLIYQKSQEQKEDTQAHSASG